jgi:DNA-binding CsgD family transcriptional regulator
LKPQNLGFAFFGAWNFIVFFSTVLTGSYSNISAANSRFSLASSIANVVTFAAVFILARRLSPICEKKACGIAMAFIGGLGTGIVGIGSVFEPVQQGYLLTVGGLLTGAGSAWVLVCWGEYLSTLSISRVTACALLSYGISFLLYFLITAFSPSVGIVLCSLLLPVCGYLAFISARDADALPVETAASPKRFVQQTWRAIFAFLVFGAVFWFSFASRAPETADTYGDQLRISLLGSALLIILLTAAAILLSKKFSHSMILRLALPLTACGLMLTFLLDSQVSGLGFAFSMSALTCLDIFLLIVVCNASHTTGMPPARAISVGRFFEGLCGPTGIVLAGLLSPLIASVENSLFILLLVICVLVILSTSVFSDTKIFEKDTLPETGGETVSTVIDVNQFARQCDYAINKFHLSEREGEILALVSRGRNVPHISSCLHIANSTTKTHVKSIYNKLCVSGRQEMLDLIESLDPAEQ